MAQAETKVSVKDEDVAMLPRDDKDWERQDRLDEEEMQRFFQGQVEGLSGGGGIQLPDDDHQFDQSGKADDAQDFEDLSDDELPEEEGASAARPPASTDIPGLTDDGGTSNDADDLWGEGDDRESSPLQMGAPPSPIAEPADAADVQDSGPAPDDADVQVGADVEASRPQPSDFDINFPQADFSLNQDPDIPAVAQTEPELVRSVWPSFDTGTYFDWNRLLPPKKATWVGKKAQRAPKPLAPTKLSLDLDVDQEKAFRIPGPAAGTTRQKIQDAEAKSLVSLLVPEPVEEADIAIFSKELEDDTELVGGYTLADIETICYDFESMIDAGRPLSPPLTPQPNSDDVDRKGGEPNGNGVDIKDDDFWDKMFLDEPPAKRRKIVVEKGLPRVPRFEAPNFDQFEEATVRAAKRVHLDFADPFLLMEEEQAPKRQKLNRAGGKRMANGRFGRDVKSRFNFSNDEHYEQLKLNHKHKVRATIGNLSVEHSLPATKLLWPYYMVRQDGIDPYEYHRPSLQTSKELNSFVKLVQSSSLKRKDKRIQKVQEAFASSKDLTLSDNSTAVLFEYCEQVPTVLSKFGMGNKIINHARKKANTDDDTTLIDKKQYELGEPNILLTEDKSPFSIFGRVDHGEVVPTLQNAMFQAPIFKHKPRRSDFLCGRSHTGAGGSNYYVRKIDHLYVVGQNFPTMEVPGPHSRRVTTLSKNRMKMISFRLIHSKGHVALQDITHHVKNSTDAQNRQKLKEFLSYERETKSWNIKENDQLMDKDSIDKMIKPEEVCLNDAHQVGVGELLVNGYTVSRVDDSADQELGDDNNDASFAKSMAPWFTTKAFIDACAGKAMVRLRGPGDPTGHGLGFSFIKTSMKGGYMEALQRDRGPGTTSADSMALEAQRKDANGHSYNVKQQDELYNKEIGEIWAKQRSTLSDPTEHDAEDLQPQEDEDDRFGTGAAGAGADGGSQIIPATPGGFRAGGGSYSAVNCSTFMDDKTSVFSRRSATDAGGSTGRKRKMLRIYRKPKLANGDDGAEEQVEMVLDSGVMKRYIDAKRKALAEEVDLFAGNVVFTGDAEHDAALLSQINAEEARLVRNRERRLQREKSKQHNGKFSVAAPFDRDPDSPAPSIEKGAGGGAGTTNRKCANCGKKGHIKTNKKLCPMLNGTYTKETGGHEEAGGFGDVATGA
ncbi:hypothetical protein RB598_005628 [Gaeumannomyces tritici]